MLFIDSSIKILGRLLAPNDDEVVSGPWIVAGGSQGVHARQQLTSRTSSQRGDGVTRMKALSPAQGYKK